MITAEEVIQNIKGLKSSMLEQGFMPKTLRLNTLHVEQLSEYFKIDLSGNEYLFDLALDHSYEYPINHVYIFR